MSGRTYLSLEKGRRGGVRGRWARGGGEGEAGQWDDRSERPALALGRNRAVHIYWGENLTPSQRITA